MFMKVAGVAVLALVVSGGVGNAVAGTLDSPRQASLSASDLELKQHLLDDGVKEESILGLIRKVDSGQMLDSQQSGAEPVSSRRWSDSDFDYVRDEFADGSYRITSVEKPRNEVLAKMLGLKTGISGCHSQSGTGYSAKTDCKISASEATFSASFLASYTFQQGGPSVITKAANGNVKTFGGTASSIVTKIYRKESSGSTPATAYLRWYFKSTGSVASGTTYVYLHVKPDNDWVEVD